MNVHFTYRDLQTIRKFVFVSQKTTWKALKFEIKSEKVTVRIVLHGDGVIGSHTFNNVTVGTVDYFQIRETYVLPESQDLTQNAVFKQDGDPSLIKLCIRSLSD